MFKERVGETKASPTSMSKRSHKRLYILTAIALIAIAIAFAYYRGKSHAHARKRSQPVAPAGVAEQQMLQGKFDPNISQEQRQLVSAALQASDQPASAPPVAQRVQVRPGEQHIVLTQPLGTTVEDAEPTLTWDANVDGWSYKVRAEDQNTHQIVTSPILDEAMWQLATPLLRGHTYLWSVDAMPAGTRVTATSVTSAPARFTVLSEEGEQAIQNAKAQHASHLLLGSLYTHYEMWREAVLEYRKMVNEVPDSPEAMKLLRNAELRASSEATAASAR